MIKAQDVTQDIYSKVEGSIWRNVQRIMGWGWYVTGRTLSVAPTEHQMIEYGREWALARYFQDGGRWQDAVEEATKAMYRYAYDDIKPYIYYDKQGKNRIKARTLIYDLSETGFHNSTPGWDPAHFTTLDENQRLYHQVEYDEIEFESTLDSFNLPPVEKQIALFKAYGLNNQEIGNQLGFSREWARRSWDNVNQKLRRRYGKILQEEARYTRQSQG